MSRLCYSAIASLDGYVADQSGKFDWSAPDDEVHSFVNDQERAIGTYLYGRRLYDVMVAWETLDDDAPVMREYAELWRAADKIVYSTSLDRPASAKTRIEREFDPVAVRALKDRAKGDLSVGGPNLAAQALRADLVDEVRLFLSPVVVGGGNPALPDDVRIDLELLDERRFGNGVVYVAYRVSAPR